MILKVFFTIILISIINGKSVVTKWDGNGNEMRWDYDFGETTYELEASTYEIEASTESLPTTTTTTEGLYQVLVLFSKLACLFKRYNLPLRMQQWR